MNLAEAGPGRERLGGVADRIGPPGGDEISSRQRRVRVTVGIMEAHEVVLDPGDHDIVVGPDRSTRARLVQEQPELQRAGQQRAARPGLPQQRRGLGLRPGGQAGARPSQQPDRRVQADAGIPPERVEKRRRPAEEFRAERRAGQHLDHRRAGSLRAKHHGQAIGIAVWPGADIAHRHAGYHDRILPRISTRWRCRMADLIVDGYELVLRLTAFGTRRY